jgi:hypothetical protein
MCHESAAEKPWRQLLPKPIRGCGRQTSVIAGTLFATSHLPLRLWFEAIWHVTSQKSEASALPIEIGELSHGVEFAQGR